MIFDIFFFLNELFKNCKFIGIENRMVDRIRNYLIGMYFLL